MAAAEPRPNGLLQRIAALFAAEPALHSGDDSHALAADDDPDEL